METNLSDRAVAYADVLAVLAAHVALPTAELADSWRDGSLVEGLSEAADVLDASDVRVTLDKLGEPSSLSELRQDHTRLFAHPKAPLVPLYESHYRAVLQGKADRPLLVVNRTAVGLDDAYRNAGFAHAAGRTVSGDRMDIELTFLMHLIERGDADSVQQFADEHLVDWAPSFFADVQRCAATPEYRLIGKLGQAVFTKDIN